MRDEKTQDTAAVHDEKAFEAYRKAFSGFSDDEIEILDGVILEPIDKESGANS